MKSHIKRVAQLDRKWKIAVIAVTALFIFAMPSYYFYSKYASLERMIKNPAAARAGAVNEVVKKVGARIQLPTGETPQLVTVSNKEKLGGLAFFKNAQNGDKVLLYEKAKMAYLYRPSTDSLINAAPIVNPEEQIRAVAENTPAQNVTPGPVKVAVYNGTATAGFARETGTKVESAYPQAEIVSVGNAEESYNQTIVVDLSGTNKAAAEAIAKGIGAKVTTIPPMEKKPEADILVIAGGT